jgi:hypothetical protein
MPVILVLWRQGQGQPELHAETLKIPRSGGIAQW